MEPTSDRIASINQYISEVLLPKYFPRLVSKPEIDPMEAFFKIKSIGKGKHYVLTTPASVETAEIVARPLAEKIFILYDATADALESINTMLEKSPDMRAHYGNTMIFRDGMQVTKKPMTRKEFMAL